jgi:hypothetical protein
MHPRRITIDPEATLLNAELYIIAKDFVHAKQMLNCYRNWRDRGGFEPVINGRSGDIFYKELKDKIT